MANYVDKFKTNTTSTSALFPAATGVDGDHISSMTTFNLLVGRNFAFQSGSKSWRSWLSGTKWTVGCLNIFDRQPPLVSDSTAYYSQYTDPRQRYVDVKIKKSL